MSAATAVALLAEILRQALAISALIKAAQDENRDLTPEELGAVVQRDDVARATLVLAIEKARTEGR